MENQVNKQLIPSKNSFLYRGSMYLDLGAHYLENTKKGSPVSVYWNGKLVNKHLSSCLQGWSSVRIIFPISDF